MSLPGAKGCAINIHWRRLHFPCSIRIGKQLSSTRIDTFPLFPAYFC